MANSKVPHEIADKLHEVETLILVDIEEEERVTADEGSPEEIAESILPLVVSKNDAFTNEVDDIFADCGHGTDCRLETCGSTRNNVVPSTMTEDGLAKLGDEGALLGNLIGFKDGISVIEKPNSSSIKYTRRVEGKY